MIAPLVAALVAVALDRRAIGHIAIPRAGGSPLVALAPLARAMGIRLVRRGADVAFVRPDRTLVAHVGTSDLREDGDVLAPLDEPLRERRGTLLAPIADAARLLGISARTVGGAIVFERTQRLDTTTTVVEVAVAPAPARTRPPRARVAPDRADDVRDVARVALSLDRRDATNVVRLEARGDGTSLGGTFAASGDVLPAAPIATLRVGRPERALELGALPDPLAGLVIEGGIATGVAVRRGDLGATASLVHGALDDRTIATLALHESDAGSDGISLVARHGRYDGAVLRRLRRRRAAHATHTSEVLVADRGVGFGEDLRTDGRTFVDTTLAAAVGTLPGSERGIPLRAGIGREFGGGANALVGAFGGGGRRVRPFVRLAEATPSLRASLVVGVASPVASIASSRGDLSLSADASFGPGAARDLDARLDVERGVLEARAADDGGARSASLTWHAAPAHAGIDTFAGVGIDRKTVGPIVGVALPLVRGLAVETSLRPHAAHRTALHVGLVLDISARRRDARAGARLALAVEVPDARRYDVVVDGTVVRRTSGARASIDVAPGAHTIALQSADGTSASSDVDLEVAPTGASVALALWPRRTIVGRVALASDARLRAPDLAGIAVVAEPGGAIAQTDALGRFAFINEPLAPGTALVVATPSLPDGTRAPEPISIDAPDLVLTLRSGLRVERRTFPPVALSRAAP